MGGAPAISSRQSRPWFLTASGAGRRGQGTREGRGEEEEQESQTRVSSDGGEGRTWGARRRLGVNPLAPRARGGAVGRMEDTPPASTAADSRCSRPRPVWGTMTVSLSLARRSDHRERALPGTGRPPGRAGGRARKGGRGTDCPALVALVARSRRRLPWGPRGPANHCGAAGPLTSRMEALAPTRPGQVGPRRLPKAPSPLTPNAASARTPRSGDPASPQPGRGVMPPGAPPPAAPSPWP